VCSCLQVEDEEVCAAWADGGLALCSSVDGRLVRWCTSSYLIGDVSLSPCEVLDTIGGNGSRYHTMSVAEKCISERLIANSS
jgi:hypothetical protein